MSRSLDYSMSVIVQRALPDVRDGLKPVHRRILYAMYEMGLNPDRPYKKSAAVVGDVLGKFHPHGDSAVYDALVRMVQDFSLRMPLIDGQGNFGSIDGDPAAAYRYTEARLEALAAELLDDIERNTVDFQPNFDNQREEPTVLPSRFPNLLINGSSGIAVGMSTNVPPHNLAEIAAGVRQLVVDPDCSVDDLMRHVPGPDFPTGGFVVGREGIGKMYHEGRGRVVMRARVEKEGRRGGKEQLVVTELPYAVNKTRVIEQIVALAKKGKAEDVSDIRDETDRDGIRLVVELKRGAEAADVLQLLYRGTSLQTTFGAHLLALDEGQPREFDLKQIPRALPGSPPRRHPATEPARPREGRGRASHRRGTARRARAHRRGHRDHPGLAGPRRSVGATPGSIWPQRSPGGRDLEHAAGQAHGSRARAAGVAPR